MLVSLQRTGLSKLQCAPRCNTHGERLREHLNLMKQGIARLPCMVKVIPRGEDGI